MKITLKNIKVAEFASQETTCYQATVYVDGVRAFIAENEGHGGPDMYTPIGATGKKLLAEAEEFAKTLGNEPTFGMPWDLELLIGTLLGSARRERWIKRRSKKVTLFTLPGDAEKGVIHSANIPYSAEAEKRILKKYPEASVMRP